MARSFLGSNGTAEGLPNAGCLGHASPLRDLRDGAAARDAALGHHTRAAGHAARGAETGAPRGPRGAMRGWAKCATSRRRGPHLRGDRRGPMRRATPCRGPAPHLPGDEEVRGGDHAIVGAVRDSPRVTSHRTRTRATRVRLPRDSDQELTLPDYHAN